jgi:hypothetical protein
MLLPLLQKAFRKTGTPARPVEALHEEKERV